MKKIVIEISDHIYKCLEKRMKMNINTEMDAIVFNATPLEEVLEDIKGEINRKANSGQWSEATVYGMQKAISVIDSHISGKGDRDK